MIINRAHHGFFDELANYLICTVSLTLTCEFYCSGSVSRYADNHTMVLDAKQVGRRLIVYPATLLDQFFNKVWPEHLIIKEEPISIPADAKLPLSVFERPLSAFAQSAFVNYFERHRPEVERAFGSNIDTWPSEWNFGRAVRNAVAHGGRIYFQSARSAAVSWQGLTYRPSDNGRCILHDDLWLGDLVYLMMDMDNSRGSEHTGKVNEGAHGAKGL